MIDPIVRPCPSDRHEWAEDYDTRGLYCRRCDLEIHFAELLNYGRLDRTVIERAERDWYIKELES